MQSRAEQKIEGRSEQNRAEQSRILLRQEETHRDGGMGVTRHMCCAVQTFPILLFSSKIKTNLCISVYNWTALAI